MANGADVARDDVGPVEGGLVGGGLAVGLRVQLGVGNLFQAVQREGGGLVARLAQANAGHFGQMEEDEGIGVAQIAAVPLEGAGHAVVVQAGGHEHLLAAEDARLGTVGQDHAPAFQPRPDDTAVQHRCLVGNGR